MFSFNHIALSVLDVDMSIAFYKKVFNFKEIKNTASNSKTRWLSINQGKELHLIPRPDFKPVVNKAIHFAFSTPDIAAFIAHLNTLQITYSDWPDSPNKDYVRADGIIQIYFKDPNGYWLEVNNA